MADHADPLHQQSGQTLAAVQEPPMKLLVVTRGLNPVGGGPVEGILQLTPQLASLGVQSSLLCLDPPDAPWLEHLSFPVIALGPVSSRYGFRLGLSKRISCLAREHDAVLVHGLWQFHAFATWRALRGSDIPYFVFPHGMLDPWFKRTFPVKHLKKWAYWPWADFRVLRDARAVLFTTEQERLLARQSFWLYAANERVVGFGAMAPPADGLHLRQLFLAHFPHLRGLRLFLYLSRIHPKKGVDLLLEAFAEVAASDPSLHLVIVGPDQVGWQASLQKRAAELAIADRLTWAGMLTGDLKWGAFYASELFCLPSHQENFGVVVAEALACGLPVAIAEPVNISAEVAAAGAGLVSPDTKPGTTEALREWLALSDSEKAQMGRRAQHLFRTSFDFANVAGNLLALLKVAVDERE